MKIDIDINENYKETTVVIKAKELNDQVSEIIENLKGHKPSTITGTQNQKIYVLNPLDIHLFYSESGKVYAKTEDQRYEIKQKLYEIEDHLEGSSFIRISKSAIVNIKQIKNIEVFFNGSLVVKLNNGHEEVISRRFVSKVKEFIGMGGRS